MSSLKKALRRRPPSALRTCIGTRTLLGMVSQLARPINCHAPGTTVRYGPRQAPRKPSRACKGWSLAWESVGDLRRAPATSLRGPAVVAVIGTMLKPRSDATTGSLVHQPAFLFPTENAAA